MLETESRNPNSENLDAMSVSEIAELMNKEDAGVIEAINRQLPKIELLIEEVVKQLQAGGRLFYIGAGTSGRLGVLDAAECIPTFGISGDLVQGVIAGGEKAVSVAVEGAEDSRELAKEDLKEKNLTPNDIVVGIAASGSTPYVLGGLSFAIEMGARTGAIVNNSNSAISRLVNFPVEVVTGPEVITGSTRLKAGTAQKLVLNMISTISMVKIGKTYNNLMVDVQATNSKLVERSKKIIMEATDCSYDVASSVLKECEGSVKLAIIRILSDTTLDDAKQLLDDACGKVSKVIESLNVTEKLI